MPNSVYIHIPFCKSKCKYCSFVSFVENDCINSYIKALFDEIKYRYNNELIRTLYFGGGTPSVLQIEYIEKIFSCFKYSNTAEITLEINPDDSDLNYLKNLKSLGINRLSFGVQSFNEQILQEIGRRHASKDVFKAIENSRDAGFENISIDLIYGLPEQTLGILKNDIENAIDLEIEHISTYGLKIEEPSFYYFHTPKNIPDDDLQTDMYIMINENLKSAGFNRYEISNFTKSGHESRHNMNYWNNAEYYGFGVSAHGYEKGIRYSNFSDIKKYISNPLVHENEHIVSKQEQLEEEIFLGMRREIGINTKEINQKFNIDFNTKYSEILKKYIPQYIIPTTNGYKFTLDGVLLSNNILAEFID